MKTINEIYEELKQLRDGLVEYIKTNNKSAAKVVLINNLKIYNDILNQFEESGVLEEEKIKDRALIIASKWAEQDVEFFLDMAKKDFEIYSKSFLL